MRVLHVFSEIYPLVKTGGLADVAGALPPALEREGVDTRVLVPGYPEVVASARAMRPLLTDPHLFGAPARLGVDELAGVVVPAYVLDAPLHWGRNGGPYQNARGLDYPDNHRRFAALGWAAARIALGADPDWRPDIVHAHDWQAGLAAAYLALAPGSRPRTIQTIHNIDHSGSFDARLFAEVGLPPETFAMNGVEFYGRFSFLKAGLYFADRITTVSPTYAREIQSPEFGGGFQGLLAGRSADLVGIINGIDTSEWDPSCDRHIPQAYDADHPEPKIAAKSALARAFDIDAPSDVPLFGIVSRLVHQKGIDLLAAAASGLIESGARLVVLGTGNPIIENQLQAVAASHPSKISVRIGFDEGLAHLIQAGSDVILVPSRKEPCGLTQLYGLRYGSLPLVRRTGGLADTVLDEVTGFVFDEPTAGALLARMRDTVRAFGHRSRWRSMQRAAMNQDFSWTASARAYIGLYEDLLA